MLGKGAVLPQLEAAESFNACWQYSSETETKYLHEWGIDVAGSRLNNRYKAFIQRAPLRSAKYADTEGPPGDLLYDGAFQHIYRRSGPNSEQTHDQCVCRLTYTDSCNVLPEVCKLRPAHHLLS